MSPNRRVMSCVPSKDEGRRGRDEFSKFPVVAEDERVLSTGLRSFLFPNCRLSLSKVCQHPKNF